MPPHPSTTGSIDFIEHGVYVVTLRVRGGEDRLGSVAESAVTLSDAGRVVEEELLGIPSRHPGVLLDAFAVMPDQLRAILVIPENEGKGLPFYAPEPYDPGEKPTTQQTDEAPAASLPDVPRDESAARIEGPAAPASEPASPEPRSDRDPVGYAPLRYAPAGYSPIDYVPPKYAPVDYAPARYSGVDYKPVDYSPLKYNPMYRSSFETLNALVEELKVRVVERLAGFPWQSGFGSRLLKNGEELLRHRREIGEPPSR